MSTIERMGRVPLGAWVVLAVVIASIASVVIWAPSVMWDSLARADWGHVAGVIGIVSTAIALAAARVRAAWLAADPAGVSRGKRPWEQPGYDDEAPTSPQGPRAIDRRDRAPGDSTRPRSRRDGSASPTTLAAILTLVLVAIAAVALSGCGASAVHIHATSATIATQAASAIRAELVRARDAAIAECGARPVDERLACLDEAEELHTAAALALDAAVMAIVEYREGIEVAHLAHDQEIAAVVLSRLKSHAVSQIERAIELARASGARVDVGELALAPAGGAR